MNLDDLPALVKRMEDLDSRNQVLQTAVLEQGAAMAEILQLLKDQGPATARAIADALKGVKLTLPPMPVPPPAPLPVATPPAVNAWKMTIPQAYGPDRVVRITKDEVVS